MKIAADFFRIRAFRLRLILSILVGLLSCSALFAQHFSVSQVLMGSDTTFSINVGGTVDAENTRLYSDESMRWYLGSGVQNNVSLTIENNGSRVIRNPQIDVNGKELKYTFSQWIREIPLDNLATLDDTVKAVWWYLSEHTFYHVVSTAKWAYDNSIDPLRSYLTFGSGECDNISQIFASIMQYLGYHDTKVKVIAEGSHVVGILHAADGRSIPLDATNKVFYPDRSNERLASIEELWTDQDLVRRQHHFGLFEPEGGNNYVASWYDRKRSNDSEYDWEYSWHKTDSLELILRPGELIRFSYRDKPGKYRQFFHSDKSKIQNEAPLVSRLGTQIYSPNINGSLLDLLERQSNVTVAQVGEKNSLVLADSSLPGSFIIRLANPYVITGGSSFFSYHRDAADSLAKLAVYFSKENNASDYQRIYGSDTDKSGRITDSLDLYDLIIPTSSRMMKYYFLKFELSGNTTRGISIDSLGFKTLFEFNPDALPSLNVGFDAVRVSSSDGEVFGALQVTFSYNEIDSLSVPPAITRCIYPTDNGYVNGGEFTFQWALPAGISSADVSDSNIEVSTRPDFRFPVNSVFVKLASQQKDNSSLLQWRVPRLGLLNPGQKYYWRVSLRNKEGVWSKWSPTWTFLVNGPSIIAQPSVNSFRDSIVIQWNQGTTGTQAASYILLGSQERGFSYDQSAIISSMEQASFRIDKRNLNQLFPFYRIIALDSLGIRSGMSDLVTLEEMRLVYPSPKKMKYGESLSLPMVRIEPIEVRGKGSSLLRIVDSLRLHPIRLPKGIALTSGLLKGSVGARSDTLIRLRGFTSDSEKEFEYEIPLSIDFPENRPPQFVVLPDTVAFEDSLYSYEAWASDPDTDIFGDSVSYGVHTQPRWLQYDSTSGLLRGKPSAYDVGDTELVIEAKDNWGGAVVKSVPLRVRHTNHAPEIISHPDTMAVEDSLYVYNVTATDVDSLLFGDRIHFRLMQKPSWLEIDSLSGVISGTPVWIQARDTVVLVEAFDWNGGSTQQQFSLKVIHVNHDPIINSLADSIAHENSLYRYKFSVTDKDTVFGDLLRYMIVSGPAWLHIDSLSGNLTGIPGPLDVGIAKITLAVDDGAGATAIQSFFLTVLHTNHPPVIFSEPDTLTFQDSTYSYLTLATDVDSELFGDVLNFRPIILPSWLKLDPLSGIISGTPRDFNVSDTIVVIEVFDDSGAFARQAFPHKVVHVNNPPVITSGPVAAGIQGGLYWYPVQAVDVDTLFGNKLVYSLDEAPHWMTIANSKGIISGIPPAAGDTSVVLRVDDGKGGSVVQTFPITVTPSEFTSDTQKWILPGSSFSLQMSIPYKPMSFVWPKNANATTYDLRIWGDELDTIITAITDTSVTLPLMRSLNLETNYSWSISSIAANSVVEVDTFAFSTSQLTLGSMVLGSTVPDQFVLHQNYPNPFNPTTTIVFGLPEPASTRFEVFNILGQLVFSQEHPNQAPGYYDIVWNGSGQSGQKVSSGVYIYRLTATSTGNQLRFLRTMKMMLLR